MLFHISSTKKNIEKYDIESIATERNNRNACIVVDLAFGVATASKGLGASSCQSDWSWLARVTNAVKP